MKNRNMAYYINLFSGVLLFSFFLIVIGSGLNAQEDPLKIEENGDVKIQKLDARNAEILELDIIRKVNVQGDLHIGDWKIYESEGNLFFNKGDKYFQLTENGIKQSPVLNIGDYHEGGIIIYLDYTGQHGLVCALEDQGGPVKWLPENLMTQANLQGIYGGEYNTKKIIRLIQDPYRGFPSGDYAALLSWNYRGGGYDDWYLPSVEELQIIMRVVPAFLKLSPSSLGLYWSSTEQDDVDVNTIGLFRGEIFGELTGKVAPDGLVRSVRAF